MLRNGVNSTMVAGGSDTQSHRLHSFQPGNKNAEPKRYVPDAKWLITDCCGLFTAGIVYLLILWTLWFLPAKLTEEWPLGVRIPVSTIYCAVALYSMMNHLKCSTTNPGTVPMRSLQKDYPLPEDTILADSEGMRYCQVCDNPKSVRAHHCSECKRCILKMDHHCPWMNNCIGMNNIKFFLLFLVGICTMSIMSLSSIAYTFVMLCNTTGNTRGARTTSMAATAAPIMFPEDESTEQQVIFIDDTVRTVDLDRLGREDEEGEGEGEEGEDVVSPGTRRLKAKRRRRTTGVEHGPTCKISANNFVGMIGLALESLIFGLFTFVLTCDMCCHAKSGVTGVETLGRDGNLPHQVKLQSVRNGIQRSYRWGLEEMLGGKVTSVWTWLPVEADPDYCERGLTDTDLFLLSTRWISTYCSLETGGQQMDLAQII